MTDQPVSQRLFPVEQEFLTTDDYYTPAWIFERMGITFDLDVCAPPGGVEWVPARRFYTQADDGLTAPWRGRVWMNPPYSLPAPWITKFIAHGYGICLVPASNGKWFHDLWATADGLALVDRTALKFVNGTGGGIPIRVVLAAFGNDCVTAIRRLSVVRRIA